MYILNLGTAVSFTFEVVTRFIEVSERVLARIGQAVRKTLWYALGGSGVVTGGIRATSCGLCAGCVWAKWLSRPIFYKINK